MSGEGWRLHCTLGHRRLHTGELIPAMPGTLQIQILQLRRACGVVASSFMNLVPEPGTTRIL